MTLAYTWEPGGHCQSDAALHVASTIVGAPHAPDGPELTDAGATQVGDGPEQCGGVPEASGTSSVLAE